MRMTGLKRMIGLPVILNGRTAGSVLRGVLTADGTFTLYPDLTADRFSYGVSFASLFELLNRNGFNPEGDQEHRVPVRYGEHA